MIEASQVRPAAVETAMCRCLLVGTDPRVATPTLAVRYATVAASIIQPRGSLQTQPAEGP